MWANKPVPICSLSSRTHSDWLIHSLALGMELICSITYPSFSNNKKLSHHFKSNILFNNSIWFSVIINTSDSESKESACHVGDLGLTPGLGRSPGEGNGYPPQYSCLENSMDRGAWWATVHGLQRVRHDWLTLPPHLLAFILILTPSQFEPAACNKTATGKVIRLLFLLKSTHTLPPSLLTVVLTYQHWT